MRVSVDTAVSELERGLAGTCLATLRDNSRGLLSDPARDPSLVSAGSPVITSSSRSEVQMWLRQMQVLPTHSPSVVSSLCAVLRPRQPRWLQVHRGDVQVSQRGRLVRLPCHRRCSNDDERSANELKAEPNTHALEDYYE